MYRHHGIIMLLGYSYFLLLILMCLTPFIYRSKRNYKEGLFFTVAIFSVVGVWSLWITLYFLLPFEEKDAAVAFGLTATATTILACVFIPRTYLIMTALVRYKIASTLPQLNCNGSAEFSEVNYRSNQTLYESNHIEHIGTAPKDGMPNPNFYSANPGDSTPVNYYTDGSTLRIANAKTNECRRGIFGISRSVTPDNVYETYSAASSKRVTKF